LISYYWPPCGGPGALRPVKFAKYLPEFGVQPIVLTRRDIAYHSLDRELIGDVPGVKTIRTESLDPARVNHWLGMRRYRPKTWEGPIKKALNFPDNKLPWVPFAYEAGLGCGFDAIFVTAPPFSSFIAGYLLARRTGKPLILDFRDAWLEFPFRPYTNRLEKRMVSYWERKLVRFAPAVTVVDENIRDLLGEKYPADRSKIRVIPNGYDPGDFPAARIPSRFTISYLGTVRKERDPSKLLQAVAELIAEGKIPGNRIEVKFIGHIEEAYLRAIRQFPFARILGHRSYQSALREFSAGHLAVMITKNEELFFPSRQLEYLASGLPIIVIGRSAGAHRLTEAFEKGYPGWIFGFEDVPALKGKILEIYEKIAGGGSIRGKVPFPDFTRQNLARRLAEIIISLTAA
jgi:glycosyltransferase involved in cell wall biosynthesis